MSQLTSSDTISDEATSSDEVRTQSLLAETRSNLAHFPNTIARVFHGRGGTFPGFEAINIEWYPPTLFVQCYDKQLPEMVRHALETLFETDTRIHSIIVQTRPWPDVENVLLCSRDSHDAELEFPLTFNAPLDSDLQCIVSLGKNRNTGVFPDMRAGWEWMKQNAKDKRVLNLFSYTSIFSLFALRAGARKVVNIDMCGSAIKTSQRNHQLNDLDCGQASFWKKNILKSNSQIAKQSNFDIIVLDPPPFQKGSFNGWKDYQKLLRRCLNYLGDQGTILASLNNQQVTMPEFIEGLHESLDSIAKIEPLPLTQEIKESDPEKGLKLVLIHINKVLTAE